MTRAVVVGSGPNGLAAAVRLAAAGVDVTVLEAADTAGGGTRSVEATVPGVLHDECSGFHPLAVSNAFTREFPLHEHGLEWAWPDVQYAHPLDGGHGAAAWRSVTRTADELGRDGRAYRRMFGPLTKGFHEVAQEFLQPALHLPRHPLALARFGAYSGLPAGLLGKRFAGEPARALFAGVAAHAFRPLDSVASSAIGVALGTAAHRYGWPVAVGGTRSIGDAMTSLLRKYGGRIETGVRVRSLEELGAPDIVLLDVAPAAAADICGDLMPRRVQRAYRAYRHGPGAFQVAFAVEGGVPWSYEPARRAGTVHVGGTAAEVAAAEADACRGRMPDRPFVLLGQQSVADPSRRRDDVHPVDTYAHVPAGYTGDATEAITRQIERFAPGFRDRVVASAVRSTRRISLDNANFVDGDIVTGANTPRQLLFRPRVTLRPYDTGAPGAFLCSAATPPGAGAHGMCGYLAAGAALRSLRS
ncbi:MAG: FAD-dependent oxidoreductase [Frankiales bacterium]|nr:FAD-dependent oxidoreductase [Frankiales bacterium]